MKKPTRPRDPNQLAKLILDITTGDEEDTKVAPTKKASAGKKGGKKGGASRMSALSEEDRKKLATKAAETRWKKNAAPEAGAAKVK